MGLQWVRLDTAIARNHKVLDLVSMREGRSTAFVYTCLLAHCGEQETDGFIPRSALPFCHAKPMDMKRLVQVGLVTIDPGGGGWNIPDWAEYQPTSDVSAARSKRARDAANTRWEEYNRKKKATGKKAADDA